MTPNEFRKLALSFPEKVAKRASAPKKRPWRSGQVRLRIVEAAPSRRFPQKDAHMHECLCYCLRKKWKSGSLLVWLA